MKLTIDTVFGDFKVYERYDTEIGSFIDVYLGNQFIGEMTEPNELPNQYDLDEMESFTDKLIEFYEETL